MSDDIYFHLSSVKQPHKEDVRCIVNYRDGFITGSRDKTAKLFLPASDGSFNESQCFTGPEHYVSALCVLDMNDGTDPKIYVGSHDSKIYVYTMARGEPINVLQGHSGVVSALAANTGLPQVLSGSWDLTAILWEKDIKLFTILGHTGSILSTAFIGQSVLLTGSADKNIKAFTNTNSFIRSFMGHNDAVRAITPINHENFLSCSNDGQVLRWSLARGLLKEYDCHKTFIYSMAFVYEGEGPDNKVGFITCSEDRTAKVFTKGAMAQVIPLPCETVWGVTGLNNEDIAITGSGGYVFTFSKVATNKVDKEVEDQYNNLFNLLKFPTTEIGNKPVRDSIDDLIKVVDPYNGQKEFVRNQKKDTDVMMYLKETVGWKKIGFITGSDAKTLNKTEYEGEMYDFVISVDIEDGQPAIMLPYNIGDEPATVALAFCIKHQLPESYVPEIEDFILKKIVSSLPG